MQDLLKKVAALAELQKQASPGPWITRTNVGELTGDVWQKPESGGMLLLEPGIGPRKEAKRANAAFVAAAGSLDFAALHAALATPPTTSLVGGAAAKWVIVCKVEGRGLPFWRPNQAGYTDSITDAGKYSFDEATKICSTCHRDAEKYCVDDPALYDLITNENLSRGKEIKLWLENARLRAAASQPQQPQQPLGGPPKVTNEMIQAALASKGGAGAHLTLEEFLDFDDEPAAKQVMQIALEAALSAATPTTIEGSGSDGWVLCDGKADYQAEEEDVWVLQDGKVTHGKWMEAYWTDESEWIEQPFTHDNGRQGTIKTPPFKWGEYIDEYAMAEMDPQPTHFQPKPTAPTPSQKA